MFKRCVQTVILGFLILNPAVTPYLFAQSTGTVPRYTIEDFMATVNVFGASFSPDATKLLVTSNQSGIYNAYEVPVDGSPMKALTASTGDYVSTIGYFPGDERFLYSSDQGGNELNHVYVRDPQGKVTDLTPGDSLKAAFVGWAFDDRSFFIQTNERDPRYFDVYEITIDGYTRSLFYKNETGMDFSGVSPDKRYVALSKPNTTLDSDVYLLDRTTNDVKHITPHEGNVQNFFSGFHPDGKSLLLATDEGHEFAYVVRYDLATGGRSILVQPDWDVMYAYYSKSGKYLVAGINNDGRTEMKVFDSVTMKPIDIPAVQSGNITSVSFSRDETKMAFYVGDSKNPDDLYFAEVGGLQPRRLTHTLNKKIDPDHLVDAEVVRFKSYDGVEVPGLLYKPHEASATQKVPALVMVHGGPGGQARIGYSPLIQYLVNHGYTVYDINNRGSSGYGKTFFGMDDRKHGEADLGDVVAAKEMLARTGYVAPDQIGIIGGSYGGYMVLAALAFKPEAFAVGVDLFGVANWLRTLESIPPWWESFKQALYTEMGDPSTETDRLRRISPLFHAGNIKRPLMVLQGANDPRVLQVESDEIVAAVKANNTPVEYVIFPDEGHGFVKKENEIKGYKSILDFLDQHLRK